MTIPPDVGAALSAILYDLSDTGYPRTNLSLQQILNSDDNFQHRQALQDIVNTYNLQDVVLVDASWNHQNAAGENIYGTMNAATFKFTPSGETYVAYRGTGNGNWMYNADSAFGHEPSDMQEWAADYFDYAVSKHHTPGNELYVTGHSQGGNNAMYAMLTSDYADQITGCVSVDGPGFSKEVIDQIIQERGSDFYEAQRARCYGINGENDYVHCLGEQHIIPGDQIITVATPGAGDFGSYHDIFSHYGNGKLNYTIDENGNCVYIDEEGNVRIIESGPMAVLIEQINKNMLVHLPKEDRYVCAQAVMAFIEMLIGNKEISNLSDLSDFSTLLLEGLPLLLAIAITNPDKVLDLLREMAPEIAKWIEKHPYMSVVLAGVLSLVLVSVAAAAIVIINVVEFVKTIVESIVNLAKEIYDNIQKMFQAILDTVNQLKEFIRRNSPGGKYVGNHPQFSADTTLLREYANRLRLVNSRLMSLDRDMDDLYWQVGLLDVYDILAANLITGFSGRVVLCQGYLNSAADILEGADRQALGYLGG